MPFSAKKMAHADEPDRKFERAPRLEPELSTPSDPVRRWKLPDWVKDFHFDAAGTTDHDTATCRMNRSRLLFHASMIGLDRQHREAGATVREQGSHRKSPQREREPGRNIQRLR